MVANREVEYPQDTEQEVLHKSQHIVELHEKTIYYHTYSCNITVILLLMSQMDVQYTLHVQLLYVLCVYIGLKVFLSAML